MQGWIDNLRKFVQSKMILAKNRDNIKSRSSVAFEALIENTVVKLFNNMLNDSEQVLFSDYFVQDLKLDLYIRS